MGVRIGTETPGALKIGSETVGGMKIGSEIVYEAAAPSLQVVLAARFFLPSTTNRIWYALPHVAPRVPAGALATPAADVRLTQVTFNASRLNIFMDLSGGDLASSWETKGRTRFQTTGLDITVGAAGDAAEPYWWPYNTITRSQIDAIQTSPAPDLTVTFILP